MKRSRYIIPVGCICQGDGLYGMPCYSTEHAKLVEKELERCDREQAAAAASTGVGATIGFADWGAEKIELLRAAEAL